MRKKAIRITRFLRKSIIDTYLATRPAWISFFQGSFCFFKIFSSSISYRATGQTVLKYTKNMIYINAKKPPESIGASFIKIS